MSFVAFRLDSSKIIGSGHMQRCITLANYLKEAGVNSVFICKDNTDHFNFIAEKYGYKIHLIPQDLNEADDADQTYQILNSLQIKTLIVDHYGLALKFEQQFYNNQIKTVIIDDLMNRSHLCHILLDQNYKKNYQTAYQDLVPKKCQLFLGPQYALIRPAFYINHKSQIRPAVKPQNIFVFFGGADSAGETYRFIQEAIIEQKNQNFQYHILVSSKNSQLQKIMSLKADYFTVYIDPTDQDIAATMKSCDLYFGSGGTITWERMTVGLTGYVVSVSDNQIAGSQALHDDQFHIYLGKSSDTDFRKVPKLLSEFNLNLPKNWVENCPSKKHLDHFIQLLVKS